MALRTAMSSAIGLLLMTKCRGATIRDRRALLRKRSAFTYAHIQLEVHYARERYGRGRSFDAWTLDQPRGPGLRTPERGSPQAAGFRGRPFAGSGRPPNRSGRHAT